MAEDDKVEAEVKIEKTEPAGIEIKKTAGELPPPLDDKKLEAEKAKDEEAVTKKVTGKIPLSPAVVKPPLRFEGLILAETTGYEGWIWTEEDLEDICQLIQECGLEADPKVQVLIALATLHGVKFTGYMAWKRAGRKGDLRKKERGELEKKEVPKGEEVRT